MLKINSKTSKAILSLITYKMQDTSISNNKICCSNWKTTVKKTGYFLTACAFGINLSACGAGIVSSEARAANTNIMAFTQGTENLTAQTQVSNDDGATFNKSIFIASNNTFKANINTDNSIVTIDASTLTSNSVLTSVSGSGTFFAKPIYWNSYILTKNLGALVQVNNNMIFAVTDNKSIPDKSSTQKLIANLVFNQVTNSWEASQVDTSNFSPAPLTSLDGNYSGYLVAFGANDTSNQSAISSHVYAPIKNNGNWVYNGSSPLPSLGKNIKDYSGKPLAGTNFNLSTPDSGLICAKTLDTRCLVWGGNFKNTNDAPGVFMVYYDTEENKSYIQQFISINNESSDAYLVELATNKSATSFVALDNQNILWLGSWDDTSKTGKLNQANILDKAGKPITFTIKKIYTTNRGFIVLSSDGASYLLEIKSFDSATSAIASKLNNNSGLYILEGQQILSRQIS